MSNGTVHSGPLPAQPRVTGHWVPSAGLEGIDALHSFVTDRRVTAPYGPSSATDNQGFIGGTQDAIPTKGPANLQRQGEATHPEEYDQSRKASEVDAYRMQSDFGISDLVNGYGDTTRPRDARNYSVQTERPTAHTGPTMGYSVRRGPQLWGRFRDAFFSGDHASFAFPSTFRPAPNATGTGQGRKRFRPTSYAKPEPLASQITNTELGSNGAGVIFNNSQIPRYW
jgi:hypothetical protein